MRKLREKMLLRPKKPIDLVSTQVQTLSPALNLFLRKKNVLETKQKLKFLRDQQIFDLLGRTNFIPKYRLFFKFLCVLII
jgi:hypothetical protein